MIVVWVLASIFLHGLCFASDKYVAQTQEELREEYKAEENPNLFEGDIVLTKDQERMIFGKNEKRGGVTSPYRKWSGGVVPYTLSRNFDSHRRKVLQEAIAEYNKHTCVKFVPRTNQKDYAEFYVGNGCNSMVGRTGGRQMISIGQGCQYKGTVIHEMMHAIGFFHEQSRLDRDKYIRIYWQNIQRGLAFAFQKYRHGEADFYGEPYDLGSVMHYENYAFSVNRRPTIEAISNPKMTLGNRYGFSKIDIRQINKMYNCGGTNPVTGIPTTAPPSSCQDKDSNCPYWAGQGYCKSHAQYMQANCCKSCQGQGGQCSDGHRSCSYWASIGECKKNPNYMLVNCKKSCKVC